ncbi:MAG: Gfo/Idh/MocA family oxidoreductase [candidate division FCPU426 bacterium]
MEALKLSQTWPKPGILLPIVIIGAGGIVSDAHLPAYQRMGFPVAGIFDLDEKKAQAVAARFGLPKAFESLEEAASQKDVIFDVAVPAAQIMQVLPALPDGSAVLIQKPMGRDLAEAKSILALCRKKGLKAAVNFQLRFAPNMMVVADLLKSGRLGSITDLELRVVIDQPWQLWDFLRGIPRLEFLYHSIHYLDLIRSFLGEPLGVYARGVGHPQMPEYADTRSSIILDYGNQLRCSLVMNHTHRQGAKYKASQMMLEGTQGAVVVSMGVNLAFPKGEADFLDLALENNPWERIPLRGSWFNEAFEGPMSNLQRFVSGEDPQLVSPVEDAIKTMALVEACYLSSAQGGTPIPGSGD